MSLNSKAKLYDGISAIPVQGNLIVNRNNLEFQPDKISNQVLGNPQQYAYQSIRQINQVGGNLRIELDNKVKDGSIHILIIKNDSLKEKIEEYWKHSKASLKFSFLLKLQNLSLVKKIGISLIIVPIFLFILLSSIYNAYHLVSISLELKLGEEIYQGMIKNEVICNDSDLENSLVSMINRLNNKESPYSYQITIVESPIVNAFAIPGKHIIVYSGLIENSETPEEVAGVLAHEMSHIERRHGLQNLIRNLGISFLIEVLTSGELPVDFKETINNTIFSKYSRDFEREADALAVKKLHQAQINLRDFIRFFNNFPKKENVNYLQWTNSHPTDNERVEYLKDKAERGSFETNGILKDSETWNAIKKSCSSQ